MKRSPSARKSPPKRRGVKKATTISVQSEKQISAMCARFQLEGLILTYRDVQGALNRKYGLSLSVGTIWHLAHGHYPKDNHIRIALGLPLTVAVAVCIHCGKPPLTKHHRCTVRIPKWVSFAADWLQERERIRR